MLHGPSSTQAVSTTTTTEPPMVAIWTIGAGYDCDTGEWTVEPGPYTCAGMVPGPQEDGPWVDLEADCGASRTMFTADCDTQPVPGTPGFVPVNCCAGDCCLTRWTSTYDCDTGEWSDPVIFFQH